MDNAARRAQRNVDRVVALEQAMYDWRSRHLILVLTLSYKLEWQPSVTLDMLQQHRNQLINNCRGNTLLSGINAYVWKIEDGREGGGLHLHLVLFYDGHHRADVRIAQRIGDYWNTVITQGMGDYWNSNSQKAHHERYGHGIGTGQIDRYDYDRRDALRKTLLYLTKTTQSVSTPSNSHYRMFGTSHLPGQKRNPVRSE